MGQNVTYYTEIRRIQTTLKPTFFSAILRTSYFVSRRITLFFSQCLQNSKYPCRGEINN
jgi:hypothetical protein